MGFFLPHDHYCFLLLPAALLDPYDVYDMYRLLSSVDSHSYRIERLSTMDQPVHDTTADLQHHFLHTQ